MSIASAIQTKQQQVANAYTACNGKGATMPATQDLTNLATCIGSISSGSTPTLITKNITANGTYNASSDNADGYSSVTVNVSGGGGYPTGNYYVMNDGSIQPLYFYNVSLKNSEGTVTKNHVCFMPDFTTMGDLTETGKAYTYPSLTPEDLTEYSINAGGANFDNATLSDLLIPVDEVKQINLSGITGYAYFYFSFPSSLFASLESIDLSNATSCCLDNLFSLNNTIKTADFSGFTELSIIYSMRAVFKSSSLENLDLSSLTTVSGVQAMYQICQACTSLTSVDLSSLTTVSGVKALCQAFYNCIGLTGIDLSNLTTVSGSDALYQAFYKTAVLSVTFTSLTTLSGSRALGSIFAQSSITSLSFPALTSTSFGNYTNQFNLMLRQVTGCTVHFPSNLQSVIGSWSDVTRGFGGTNTTVLFDLPATT